MIVEISNKLSISEHTKVGTHRSREMPNYDN